MALSSELPVYKASYDLLLAIYQMVRHFSREYKYTMEENLKNQMIELLTLIYRANSNQQKADILQSAREQLEIIFDNLVVVLYFRIFRTVSVSALIISSVL